MQALWESSSRILVKSGSMMKPPEVLIFTASVLRPLFRAVTMKVDLDVICIRAAGAHEYCNANISRVDV